MEKGIGQADILIKVCRTLAGKEVDNEYQSGDTGSLELFIGKCLLPEYDCSLAQG